MFGRGSDFLDPRYCRLLDKLMPSATQNRLSYLVELLLDKNGKGISNEAIKIRLRKDSAAFSVENMPSDTHSVSNFHGSRTLQDMFLDIDASSMIARMPE